MDLRLPGEPGVAPEGTLQFIGTATVLLRFGGFTVLTDPNFLHHGEKVHLGFGLTSTRRTDPALELDALPPLDLVLLSHRHEDHFDRIVERRLDRSVPIVTNPTAARQLAGRGFKTVPLARWESALFHRGERALRITAVPARHGPRHVSRALPPVMGSVLDYSGPEPGSRLRVYVTGDTLVHGDLREIPRRFPGIDLALLHLGGTRIFGVLLTMDGKQGVELIRIVDPIKAVPIHYDDYTVFRSPLGDFQREVKAAGLEHRVVYVERGSILRLRGPVERAGEGAPVSGEPPPPP